MRYPTNKGSVLILALWALLFLTILSVAINLQVWPQLNVAGKLIYRAKARYIARSGIMRTMVEMEKDKTEEYDALSDFWNDDSATFKDVQVGDGEYSIISEVPPPADSPAESAVYGLVDEERKININNASLDILARLFEKTSGLKDEESKEIAASIIDWRDEDDESTQHIGAENSYYSSLTPSYHCKNGKFERLEELMLAKGVNKDIFDKVKTRITIYGEGAVNINTADALVLESTGMSEAMAAKVIHYRGGDDGVEGTGDDNVFEEASNAASVLNSAEGLSAEEINILNKLVGLGMIAVRSDHFTGTSVARIGQRKDISKIVFVFERGKKAIEYWMEN